jgi:hypothetical protein
VVTLFATWCFPCLAQLEILRSLASRLGPRGLFVEAVALDLEGEKVVRPFAEHAQYPFPIQTGSAALREGQTALGRVSALPTTYLVDHAERTLAFEGVAREEQLEKTLTPLLGGEDATSLKRVSCPGRTAW